MAAYDTWSTYYDVVHTGLKGEAEFYVGQAVRIGGRTLEIGCGTGRIAIPMAMSGVDVTGIDDSRAMLDACREKLEAVGEVPGRLTLVQADMRSFDLGERFSFIAMPYRTFMHCQTMEDQQACLECVRSHLADDGVFALNLWAARASFVARHSGSDSGNLQFVSRYPLTEQDGGWQVVHYCATLCNEYRQELIEEHVIHLVDADGATQETTVLNMTRTWLTRREMEHLLVASGFHVRALFGDFDCGPFDERSSEMIWVVSKR